MKAGIKRCWNRIFIPNVQVRRSAVGHNYSCVVEIPCERLCVSGEQGSVRQTNTEKCRAAAESEKVGCIRDGRENRLESSDMAEINELVCGL